MKTSTTLTLVLAMLCVHCAGEVDTSPAPTVVAPVTAPTIALTAPDADAAPAPEVDAAPAPPVVDAGATPPDAAPAPPVVDAGATPPDAAPAPPVVDAGATPPDAAPDAGCTSYLDNFCTTHTNLAHLFACDTSAELPYAGCAVAVGAGALPPGKATFYCCP